MKKIEVIVKDKNTLVLATDANKDDYIDLTDLASVDLSQLEAVIEAKRDSLYEAKLKEFKRTIDAENNAKLVENKAIYDHKLQDLQNVINGLNDKKNAEMLEKTKDFELEKKNVEAKFINEINSIKEDYQKIINELNNKLSNYETEKNSLVAKKELEYKLSINESKATYEARIKDINTKNQIELEKLSNRIDDLVKNQDIVVENEKLKLKEMHQKETDNLKKVLSDKDLAYANMEASYKEKLIEKDNAYSMLQRQKASLNVKQTGEDLEAWCDNEMKSYQQVGLFNTTWVKDNDVVRDEGEAKGSKADYIFKIYATEEHNPMDELASVCLDMKDENPDSVTKQTNEHYYKALDKNRIKKNCKYAVLVSNLETDKPNDVPVWKVKEYPDMYVVRPAYMMTFLSMLNSLTIRFRDLLLEGNKERLELMNAIELKEKFEALKLTYLDKPLEGLSKCIENIRSQSIKLKEISVKIDEECDKATRNYLNQIENKLTKFDIEIDKAYRKYEKTIK